MRGTLCRGSWRRRSWTCWRVREPHTAVCCHSVSLPQIDESLVCVWCVCVCGGGSSGLDKWRYDNRSPFYDAEQVELKLRHIQ